MFCRRFALSMAQILSVTPWSKSTFVDYESVAVLKKHKIEMLYKILEGAVERKYKISFAKGMQLLLENICLFLLMISVVLKANVFALIYLIFIFKYLMSSAKQNLLVRMASYISLCLIIPNAIVLAFILSSSMSLNFSISFCHSYLICAFP